MTALPTSHIPSQSDLISEVWACEHNNVWIAANKARTIFEVSHRHIGGCFPRLFPLKWAPDMVTCSTAKIAAKHAANMIRAYRRSRLGAVAFKDAA